MLTDGKIQALDYRGSPVTVTIVLMGFRAGHRSSY